MTLTAAKPLLFACALLLAWLAESLLLALGWMVGMGRTRRTQQRHWR